MTHKYLILDKYSSQNLKKELRTAKLTVSCSFFYFYYIWLYSILKK